MKADIPDYTEKKAQHIAKRYEHHKSFRSLAEEFGMSKSQVHRTVKSYEKDNPDN